ncbi:MAG TPA: hypothetical protein VNA20_10410 [Frankiaceae bacterium]|nr:hypothetical protein [Frankiaceae bacterium]
MTNNLSRDGLLEAIDPDLVERWAADVGTRVNDKVKFACRIHE